jgi:hypothetical protein
MYALGLRKGLESGIWACEVGLMALDDTLDSVRFGCEISVVVCIYEGFVF